MRPETRRAWTRRAALAACAGLATHQLVRHGYEYVLPIRFFEVLPGRLYRGAWQQPWPMRMILRTHEIKTVVALAHTEGHDLALREKALARESGARWLHIPIVDDPRIGHGKAIDALIDEAADALADPANHPVYFHCHHGKNRSSMAQMAWRTKHCGWSLDRSASELLATLGPDCVPPADDYARISGYYQRVVVPNRPISVS